MNSKNNAFWATPCSSSSCFSWFLATGLIWNSLPLDFRKFCRFDHRPTIAERCQEIQCCVPLCFHEFHYGAYQGKKWIKVNKICASIAHCYGNANLESILLEMSRQSNNAVFKDSNKNLRF